MKVQDWRKEFHLVGKSSVEKEIHYRQFDKMLAFE